MKAGRTLHPEDLLSHYRVVGPLGAGGMGEVYLAQDQTLERNVALKVLPAELVKDQDRVRRFVLEAKSASSLSHPNIVTIYEIGSDVVRSADGATDRDATPVQFISMELISGKTLSTLIHDEKTDLRTLLGYLSQAAEGLAKAHAAGIVHRDLKPGNIMVSTDGFAKVLDFGLAKLSERRDADPEQTSAPTMMEEATGAGAILGTTGYMSPEQVQGKSADHRSDIFSFGCVLYEAATRQRPFVADSAVETMHKILHDKPTAIEERNPKAPAELRRLVRRCLAKSPDQRVQSMKDIALELREIADEWDSLSASATSMATSSSSVVRAATATHRSLLAVTIGIALVAIVAIAIAVWAVRRGGGSESQQPFQTMRMSTKTSRGDLTEAALSRDGRYLAYLTGALGKGSVRVRQVATGADVEVVPAEEGLLEGLSFTPDGNYLFYLRRRRDAPNYRTLMQVPSLGGDSRERAFDVDSRVSFSPDGKRVCFTRGVPQTASANLVVLELDTAKERVLASITNPGRFSSAPAWSPDGQRIATVEEATSSGSIVSAVITFDVESGRREEVSVTKNAIHDSLAWLSDGSGLIQSGIDLSQSVSRQISLLTYPEGNARRVTNDLDEYVQVTVSSGDEAIAAVRRSRLANLWVADVSGGEARPITKFTNSRDTPFASVTVDDGSIVFSAPRDQSVQLWSVGTKGGAPKPITPNVEIALNPRSIPGGVLFQSYDKDRGMSVWQTDLAGSAARALLPGTAATLVDAARDGSFLLFDKVDVDDGVWLLPLKGGQPRNLGPQIRTALISPDASRILVYELSASPDGLMRPTVKILPVNSGAAVTSLAVQDNATRSVWGADSSSLSFLDDSDPIRNLSRIRLPNGKPERVTRFTEGRCTTFEWSPDGTRLAIARRIGDATNVWVMAADGSKPVQLTRFPNDEVFQLHWSHDGKQVVINAGKNSSDAVLITNFR